jgi:cytochrome c1
MSLNKIAKKMMLLLIFISFLGPVVATAAEGNARKGKYLYRKYCLKCHKAGATGDRVGKPLSPISKTQAQWEVVFKNHEGLTCNDQWAKRKAKDIKDIYAHLWGHAFDSPSPAKCE